MELCTAEVEKIPEMLAKILWKEGPESECRNVVVDTVKKLVHFSMKEVGDSVWDSVTWHLFESTLC
jgi:hypothetical protein